MTKKYDTWMAYSCDLRKKALDYIEKGHSKEEASQIFGVTTRSIFNWIKRKEQNCLAPNKTRKRRPGKIEGEKLKAYLQKNPDSYLREVAECFGTTITAVFYACKRLKITLKKRHPSIKREMIRKEKSFRKD